MEDAPIKTFPGGTQDAPDIVRTQTVREEPFCPTCNRRTMFRDYGKGLFCAVCRTYRVGMVDDTLDPGTISPSTARWGLISPTQPRRIVTWARFVRLSRLGIAGTLFVTVLFLTAHQVNDHLLPVGADDANDIWPTYARLGGGCLLLLSALIGIFLVKRRWPSPLPARVATLVLVLVANVAAWAGAGFSLFAAVGDWEGGYNGIPLCRIGQKIVNGPDAPSLPSCVPSLVADQIQLPLHLIAAFLLVLVAVTFLWNTSAATRVWADRTPANAVTAP